MEFPILSAQELYTREEEYEQSIDPTWHLERWKTDDEYEIAQLSAALGEAQGRTVLDCTCGTGNQAIPLAKLGWQVTATDFTDAYLSQARQRAQQQSLEIHFQPCDVRNLGEFFQGEFDWVISCMALDNITEDGGIQQAIRGMYGALKPGGKCYIRLRDLDNIMQERPRYEFKRDRILPYGRVLMMEDWIYESETHVVHVDVYWLEDHRKSGYQWSQEIFAYRRRALRKAELAGFLREAGFRTVDFLPQPSPWHPYEVIASS
jgi:glycine/sarcosine N-methyltransferase